MKKLLIILFAVSTIASSQVKLKKVSTDTTLSKIEILKILTDQKKQLEMAIIQLDGKIQAIQAISQDSIKVKKENGPPSK